MGAEYPKPHVFPVTVVRSDIGDASQERAHNFRGACDALVLTLNISVLSQHFPRHYILGK